MTKKKKIQNREQNQSKSKWLQNDLAESTDLMKCVSILKDFRHIPLYPTVEDLRTKDSTSLRAIHTNHPYNSCHDYLDAFFRLMREDFISDVRDTLKLVNTVSTVKRDTLWYFKNVSVIKKKLSVQMFFQFDSASNAKSFDYENSKQFKNGSLMLISKDQFITFTLGTVTDTVRLNKGIVGVDVIDFSEISNWKSISLLEPKVFYEPYRYVMAVLQDMYELNFPMKRYIVYGEKNISHPAYLKNNSTFTINGITFDILQDTQWPSAKVLDMDINQYEAFKGALTKEFVMIQGPPGTGKTYLGLKIVKTIVENMYKIKELTHPIMVVCMTNHALDQFLEGVWKITKNISRFGRGTNSDILVNFVPTMKVVRKDKCADIYVKARNIVANSVFEECAHISYIKDITRNDGILDLSFIRQILCVRDFGGWFQDSYDFISWLLFDIPYVNGVNPSDFIKKKKLLSSWPTNVTVDLTKKNLYCISLESIKLYCTQLLQKLDILNKNFHKDLYSNEKQNLELELEIIRTVEDYIIKHLKLYMSESNVEYNNQIDRDSLNEEERWLLYYKWVHIFLEEQNNVLECLKEKTRQNTRDMKKFKSIGFLNSMRNKYVIGMTTTAAARNRFLLENLKCPIVIIEEAAEVLEPHIVASLSEHCEHLILIGDHQQLRPQTANHLIAKEYNLGISLFERMVNNQIPSFVLAEQRRMRPEIAGLVTPFIYPNLKNHPSVMKRTHIRGVDADVFCITNCAAEEKDAEQSSYNNSSEAKFLVALANYLLKQRYYPEQITILTMYNAQLQYISNLINSSTCEKLKAIRVSSVDGYQGEENDIVLLSLVRSNSNKSIGFLKTSNRVCVALSRAKLGFYIVGNLDLLAQVSSLWKNVKSYLRKLKALGPKLMLKCQEHGICLGYVSNSLDFERLASCESVCNFAMNTFSHGRSSNEVCVTRNGDHSSDKRSYPCQKKCPRGHKCIKKRNEKCNKCEVLISIVGVCGHTFQGKCWNVEQLKCTNICSKTNCRCPFRHPCKYECGQPCGPCTQYSIPVIMKCGHVLDLPCSSKPYSVQCEKCSAELSFSSSSCKEIPENEADKKEMRN